MAFLVASPALAYQIRVNFTVTGSDIDPPCAGLTSSGFFTFDSGLIPVGGGTLSNSYNGLPGLFINEISFSWDGHDWTTADASCFELSFSPDGSVIGFAIGGNDGGNTTGLDCPPFCTDFIVRVYPFSQQQPQFIYAAHRGENTPFYGSVSSWDAAIPPFMVASWGAQGSYFEMDSYGQVYTHGAPCPGTLGTVTVVGRLSNTQLPSSVAGVVFQDGEIVATLANGDVYSICGGASVGAFVGNIFNAPGVAAVEGQGSPTRNRFSQNRPNPFNPDTAIPYALASPGRVRILVFDVSGRLVRTLEDSTRQAGQYTARWNGQNDHGEPSASGTYFARIIYPDGSKAEQKMTVLR